MGPYCGLSLPGGVICPAPHWNLELYRPLARRQLLIADRTICCPGLDLHWCLWSTVNRFGTGQG